MDQELLRLLLKSFPPRDQRLAERQRAGQHSDDFLVIRGYRIPRDGQPDWSVRARQGE